MSSKFSTNLLDSWHLGTGIVSLMWMLTIFSMSIFGSLLSSQVPFLIEYSFMTSHEFHTLCLRIFKFGVWGVGFGGLGSWVLGFVGQPFTNLVYIITSKDMSANNGLVKVPMERLESKIRS